MHSGLWPRLDGWYGVSQSNLDSSLYDWLRVPGAESCYYHRLSLLFSPCVASSGKQCRGLTNGLSRTKDSSYCMYYKSLCYVVHNSLLGWYIVKLQANLIFNIFKQWFEKTICFWCIFGLIWLSFGASCCFKRKKGRFLIEIAIIFLKNEFNFLTGG